jgi:hypothetical protein
MVPGDPFLPASVIEHKLGHRQEEPAGRCLINYISAKVLRRRVAERNYRVYAQGNERTRCSGYLDWSRPCVTPFL